MKKLDEDEKIEGLLWTGIVILAIIIAIGMIKIWTKYG